VWWGFIALWLVGVFPQPILCGPGWIGSGVLVTSHEDGGSRRRLAREGCVVDDR